MSSTVQPNHSANLEPPSSEDRAASSKTWSRVILIVAVLVTFGQACRYDFINFDDYETVVDNPLMNPTTPHSLWVWWTSPNFQLYDPMTATVRGLVASLARVSPDPITGESLNPWVFHAVNIVLHIGVTLLVYQLLLHLALPPWPACGGALLFAIHPVQVEPVVWITSIKDLLYGTFALLAIWRLLVSLGTPSPGTPAFGSEAQARRGEGRGEGDLERKKSLENSRKIPDRHQSPPTFEITLTPTLSSSSLCLRAEGRSTGRGGRSAATVVQDVARGKSRWNYVFATLFFLLAMFSKPTGIIVPLVAIPIVWASYRGVPVRARYRLAFWFLLAIPFFIVATLAQPAPYVSRVTIWKRFLVAGDALAFYLYKIVWPKTLLLHYGRNPAYITQHGFIWWTWGIPVALIAVLCMNRRRYAPALAGMLVFIAGLLPVLGMVGFNFQYYSTVADRYLYLPMFGIALIAAWGLSRLPHRYALFAALPMALLAARSAMQVRYWQDSLTLFQHVLDNEPRSAVAYAQYATELLRRSEFQSACDFAGKSIALDPHRCEAYDTLAKAQASLGRTDEAVRTYREGFREDFRIKEPLNLFTLALLNEGNPQRALVFARLNVELASEVVPYTNLGAALAETGDWQGALHSLQTAVSLDAKNYNAQCDLASVLYHFGDRPGAMAHYRVAESLDPGDLRAATALRELGVSTR